MIRSRLLPTICLVTLFSHTIHAAIIGPPRLTLPECVINQTCTIQWVTDDCSRGGKYKLWLNRTVETTTSSGDHDLILLKPSEQPDVLENDCEFVMDPYTTRGFRNGGQYSISMAPYNSSFAADGWNPDHEDRKTGEKFIAVSEHNNSSQEQSQGRPFCGTRTAVTPQAIASVWLMDEREAIIMFAWDETLLVALVVASAAWWIGAACAMLIYAAAFDNAKRRQRRQQQGRVGCEEIARSQEHQPHLDAPPTELEHNRKMLPDSVSMELSSSQHPGTPFKFPEPLPSPKQHSPFVHELSASPVAPFDDIWQGPGPAKIEPVGRFDDASVPDLLPLDNDNAVMRIEPGWTGKRHLSPSPAKHTRKTSKTNKEPEFEMVTRDSFRSLSGAAMAEEAVEAGGS